MVLAICAFLDPSNLQTLAWVEPFQDAALDELRRVCGNVESLLRVLCPEHNAVQPAHAGCIGRPSADDGQFQRGWQAVSSQAAILKKIEFNEGDATSCANCLHAAAKALAKPERALPPLFRNATEAIVTILSTNGLYFFNKRFVFPATLTKLDFTASGEISHLLVGRVLQSLPALEHLRVETDRAKASRIPLKTYTGLSAQLRTLRITDSCALAYGVDDLRRFMGGYPRLTALSLNPTPERAGTGGALPSLRCLEALSAQPVDEATAAGEAEVPALETFAALLRFEPVDWELPPPRPSRVRALNFGVSRSCVGMDGVKAYVRRLFPGAKIRAESTGVAGMDKDEV